MADIVIINPRFDTSFWGMEHCVGLFGKRANLPVACLALLAALVPGHHAVTLIDENVEDVDFDRLGRADLVCLTGMCIQGRRMSEILKEVRSRGVMTVVGGPLVTVEEETLNGLADVVFVGEADETWPQFLHDWEQGCHKSRYEQPEKTDLARLPLPRIDLLKTDRYMFGSMQISRGCPFTCEFCDIIVTFGRRPRLKTSQQVLAELESFRRAGLNIIFVVDDNLIGNKKAIKPILQDVIHWQEKHGYALSLFTEASIDLADDAELMQLMTDANIIAVFIGIESPNEASLRETKKYQNVRAGGTILEKVHRIQDAGMDVWCGMILGFDNDDETIFDAQREFIKDARIANSMTGMLWAFRKTPLYDRLLAEGRLDPSDEPEFGTNVIPLKISREQLRDGYISVMDDLYTPAAYFGRLDDLIINGRLDMGRGRSRYWKRHPFSFLKWQTLWTVQSLGLYFRLMTGVPDVKLRREYHRRVMNLIKHRRDPGLWLYYLIKVAFHYHAHTLARQLTSREKLVNSY
jgi:radical SAM superfamily enzyme YgiQ (UPF0313 family)